MVIGCATLSRYNNTSWSNISGSISIADSSGVTVNNYKTAITNQSGTFSLNVSGNLSVGVLSAVYGLSVYCSTTCSSPTTAITFRAIRIA